MDVSLFFRRDGAPLAPVCCVVENKRIDLRISPPTRRSCFLCKLLLVIDRRVTTSFNVRLVKSSLDYIIILTAFLRGRDRSNRQQQ